MRIRNLLPWPQLTRNSGGIPPMRVIRKPLSLGGEIFHPGEQVGASYIGSTRNRIRLRQLYEQLRIQPVTEPPTTKQAHKERMQRIGGLTTAIQRATAGLKSSQRKSVPALTVSVAIESMPEVAVPVHTGYTPPRSRKKG